MLVDIYLLVSKRDRLTKKYIYWGIENMIEAEKNLQYCQRDLGEILKND
jgi:hypothetical protein